MTLTETQFRNALVDAAEAGAIKALCEVDKMPPDMSLRQAQRKYGPAVVRRWLKEGLIEFRQDGKGAKKRIDRVKIAAVAAASNMAEYMTTAEIKQNHNL